jgi:hypothetical protein
MLKNSPEYSMWFDLRNIVVLHYMCREVCCLDGVLGESIFGCKSSGGVFQHNPPFPVVRIYEKAFLGFSLVFRHGAQPAGDVTGRPIRGIRSRR